MEHSTSSSRFAGSAFNQYRHVCAFFNTLEEQYRVLRPFIIEGFAEGAKACHLVDPQRREEHIRQLTEAGIEVSQAISAGQLEVRPWQDGPLRGDHFDEDAWLALLEQLLQSGPEAGYVHTRYLAHMEWALVGPLDSDDLIEFETKLNYLTPNRDDPVICAYDLTRFGASVVMDALRTHPLVIIGGLLQENPFFIPPDQFLLELRERRAARKSGSAVR
jgi:hypothetical protein